jgi:protein required for attachment to host cells
MIAKITTWILLASGSGARIVANDGVGHGIGPVEGAVFTHDAKRDSDVYADRQGRVHDRYGPGRHAAERRTDGRTQDREAFAAELAGYLAKAGERQAYDRLILIAEPSFLGLLRKAITGPAADRIVGEIAKDLGRAETDELVEALSEHIAV